MDHELWLRLDAVDGMLARIVLSLNTLKRQGIQMSIELDALTQQVSVNTSVEGSAMVLIQGFGQRLTDLANQLAQAGIDNTMVLAERDKLSQSAQPLADAVAANTPAVP